MTTTTPLRELPAKWRKRDIFAFSKSDRNIGEEAREAYRECADELEAALAALAEPQAGIDTMVDRFLAWKLPSDFHPDAGITFAPDPAFQSPGNLNWPTGTNLLTAVQARAMFEHCAAPSPASRARPEAQGEADQYECRVILRDGFGEWHKCSREQYDHIRLTGFYNGPGGAQCEARALYATPPADRAPGEVDALRRELIRVYRSIGNDLMATKHEAALTHKEPAR